MIIKIPNSNQIYNVLGRVVTDDMKENGLVVLQSEDIHSHQLSEEFYISEKMILNSDIPYSIDTSKCTNSICVYSADLDGEFALLSPIKDSDTDYTLYYKSGIFCIRRYIDLDNKVCLKFGKSFDLLDDYLRFRVGYSSYKSQSQAYYLTSTYPQISVFVATFLVSRDWRNNPIDNK